MVLVVYGFVTRVHAQLRFRWAGRRPAPLSQDQHLHAAWKKRKLTGAKAWCFHCLSVLKLNVCCVCEDDIEVGHTGVWLTQLMLLCVCCVALSQSYSAELHTVPQLSQCRFWSCHLSYHVSTTDLLEVVPQVQSAFNDKAPAAYGLSSCVTLASMRKLCCVVDTDCAVHGNTRFVTDGRHAERWSHGLVLPLTLLDTIL
jgi:hypothetical protein